MAVGFTMRETQRSFTAKVSLVSGAADLTTHMVGVTAHVDPSENHTYWLRPGSFCDVTLDIGASRDAAVVPRTATRATDHGYVVYVAEDDVVKEVPVTLGMNSKDGWVEIRSGLSGGEWLVVRGAEALTTGARVRSTKLMSMGASAPRPEEQEGGAHREGGAWPAGSGSAGGRRAAQAAVEAAARAERLLREHHRRLDQESRLRVDADGVHDALRHRRNQPRGHQPVS